MAFKQCRFAVFFDDVRIGDRVDHVDLLAWSLPEGNRIAKASAHLELVSAHDYVAAREPDLALRSRISAASCLCSGGDIEQGRQELEKLQTQYPAQKSAIAEVMAELTRDYPAGRERGRKRTRLA
jgi:hypothetical protein